jgi:CBS domain-containing protein
MSGGLGQQGQRRQMSAAAAAALFLLLGLGVVWFASKVADVHDGAVLASFVIVPALLYVVLRGDLAELRGPGGWQATFVRVAASQVNAAGEKLDVYEDVQVIEKETMAGLTNRVNALALDQPVLMTMTLGRSYTVADVRGYLETLRQFPRFRLVALLNEAGRFIGCISPVELAGLMRTEVLSGEFLNAVAGGNELGVFRYPGMLKKVVPATATNAEALSAMAVHNLGAIAVVDNERRLRGVVEREQLMSRLLVSLTGTPAVA